MQDQLAVSDSRFCCALHTSSAVCKQMVWHHGDSSRLLDLLKQPAQSYIVALCHELLYDNDNDNDTSYY